MSTLIRTDINLSMAATVRSPWIDLRGVLDYSAMLSCGDLASPVGVITYDFSNDWVKIEAERAAGVDPANSTAIAVGMTAALGAGIVTGTVLATGYDGVGDKASYIRLGGPLGYPAYIRFVYTRTSGGATDILKINLIGRD